MTLITVWIPGDQLLAAHPAIAAARAAYPAADLRILLIESRARLQQKPYQRKKLVLLLSAMRHYAEELRVHGLTVDYVQAVTFIDGLRQHTAQHRPTALFTMAAASYDGRRGQVKLAARLNIPVMVLPNTQFLVGRFNPITEPQPDKRYVLEHFYRDMRRHFDILMDGADPAGGRWNFDHDNRRRLPAEIKLPPDIRFEPDDITAAVMREVAALPLGSGQVNDFGYAVTRDQAKAVFADFLGQRLPHFGAYEDAMTGRSHSLFHSVLAPYLNIGLLQPLPLAQAAAAAYRTGQAPINAVEGFVRQIIGWREFMYWQYWRQMPGMLDKNAWQATRPLPAFVWDGATDMACLRHAIQRALTTGYNHHIERLMLLCNFFMLAGIEPRAVNDWFLCLYIDAYEWVMPGNVIGMGLNADGGLTATKPYIASANYINKMGDFCHSCTYNHRQRHGEGACPFNYLYWNFILEHEEALKANPRTSRSTVNLRHLDDDERAAVRAAADQFMHEIFPNENEP